MHMEFNGPIPVFKVVKWIKIKKKKIQENIAFKTLKPKIIDKQSKYTTNLWPNSVCKSAVFCVWKSFVHLQVDKDSYLEIDKQ